MARQARFVQGLGLDVSLAFAEAYTHDEILRLMRAAVDVRCTSASFHDSFFRMAISPEAMKLFIRSVRGVVPEGPPRIVHLSNFFGHATMTAIAALTAGASGVDVCANGTGHHCGHTSLMEVALALHSLYGVSAGIRLERLRSLSEVVHQRTAVPVPLAQPIVGDYAFTQDGAHLLEDRHLPKEERVHATFPFEPQVVGSDERVIWNDRTLTLEALALKVAAMGREVPAAPVLEEIIGKLRARLERSGYPCWLSEEEFTEFLLWHLPDDEGDPSGERQSTLPTGEDTARVGEDLAGGEG